MILNTYQTKQSTGVSCVQLMSTKCKSSDQPAFRWISAEVSGKLNRRNQPAFKPYASDRPTLKKIAGPPIIYVSCPRCRPLFPFSLFTPPRPRSTPQPPTPISRRRSSTLQPPLRTLAPRATRHTRRRPRAPPLSLRHHPRARSRRPRCSSAAARAPLRRHHCYSTPSPRSEPPLPHALPPTQPRLHTIHAAAAADQCTPSVR